MATVIATGGVPAVQRTGPSIADVILAQILRRDEEKRQEAERKRQQEESAQGFSNVVDVMRSRDPKVPLAEHLAAQPVDVKNAFARALAINPDIQKMVIEDLVAGPQKADYMNVSPGGVIFDPGTGKAVFNNPNRGGGDYAPTVERNFVMPILAKLERGETITAQDRSILDAWQRTKADPYAFGADQSLFSGFVQKAPETTSPATQEAQAPGFFGRPYGEPSGTEKAPGAASPGFLERIFGDMVTSRNPSVMIAKGAAREVAGAARNVARDVIASDRRMVEGATRVAGGIAADPGIIPRKAREAARAVGQYGDQLRQELAATSDVKPLPHIGSKIYRPGLEVGQVYLHPKLGKVRYTSEGDFELVR